MKLNIKKLGAGGGIAGIFMAGTLLGGSDLTGPDIEGLSVRVMINEETNEGRYNDALYYTLDEWSKLTVQDIENAKQVRVQNWINSQTSQPLQPTKEELQNDANKLQENITDFQKELDDINVQINAK